MILQTLEGKRRQRVLSRGATVHVGYKEVPVVQANLEDLVVLHKGDAEQILQALEEEGLVLRLLQYADLSLQ